MANTQWWTYVESVIGDDNFKTASQKARFNQSAFTRWKRGADADPAFVVKFARAYGKNVLEALVAAEFITAEEAALKEVSTGGVLLESATDEQIASVVLKRMKSGSKLMTMPISEAEKVIEKHKSELDARRNAKRGNNSPTPPPHVTEPDYDAILDGINAGTEPIAAQKATDPLEENYT
ncbi:hypothetical protein I4J35_05995 [Corynebacterium belfantii]|uniref:hypothetical protein n=1 Tax=Corynebacterium belfantii TaxID=2014537 RepID=UPI0018D4785A|nr:hypothetical protein [Corynebacterium belfantii]MBG9328404.1 hypothetical protein [Corynebacterium belfantii]